MAVLVLNDHVLKGAGVLPGALTGKLSDLAGLIVAPVLVAALFGARTHRGRLAAFALCAVPFAAINLSPTFAAAWDAMARWSTTTDPSDLWALTVAPVALHIAASEPRPLGTWVPRCGAALGALACIATSQPEPIETTRGGPKLQNDRDEEVTVRVRWLDGTLDCDRLGEWYAADDGDALARALDPALFDIARTFTLVPGQSADLTRPAGLEDADGDWRGCDALIIGSDGLQPQLVAYFHDSDGWRAADTLSFTTTPDDRPRVAVTFGSLLRSRLAPSIPPARCEPLPPAGVFSWTGSAPPTSVVQGIEPLSEDCFVLELTERPETTETTDDTDDTDDADPTDPPRLDPLPPEVFALTVCAPREYFDFPVGTTVAVTANAETLGLTSDRQHVLLQRLDALSGSGELLCEGARLPCGAYVEPIGWGSYLPGVPEISEGSTRTTTHLLDDAVRVVANHRDCGLELGVRGVLLTHWKETE